MGCWPAPPPPNALCSRKIFSEEAWRIGKNIRNELFIDLVTGSIGFTYFLNSLLNKIFSPKIFLDPSYFRHVFPFYCHPSIFKNCKISVNQRLFYLCKVVEERVLLPTQALNQSQGIKIPSVKHYAQSVEVRWTFLQRRIGTKRHSFGG